MIFHRLANGQQVFIRPIRPEDKEQLQEGLKQLSLETVHRRFLAAKPRFSSAELRYLTEIDGFDHVAVVAVLADDPDAFVGVGRFVRLREDPRTAEVAIVVGDSFQGQGLGRALGRRLADEALERGVERFTATLLGENVAAHRLMASIARRLEAHLSGGHRELVADLAA